MLLLTGPKAGEDGTIDSLPEYQNGGFVICRILAKLEINAGHIRM